MRLLKSVPLLLLWLLALSSLLAFSVSADGGYHGAPADPPPTSADGTPKGPTYYELLGVTTTEANDAAVLKRSYRKQALLYHPDRATSADTPEARTQMESMFQRLANAYEVLSSPRMRVRYDHLVSQGNVEYDGNRDWSAFDLSRGFKKRQSKAEKEAEFKFKQAEEMFKKSADEAEAFALVTALCVALVVALMPALYMWWRRHSAATTAIAQRKERSSELKASQILLAEMQAEQAEQAKLAREEERAYQKQLRDQREAAAAEAEAEADSESAIHPSVSSPDSDSWEMVDGERRKIVAVSSPDANEVHADHDDDEDENDDNSRSSSSGVVLKCIPCKKSFKSAAQLSNHEQSNQHKKAMKDAEKGAKKKSRREE